MVVSSWIETASGLIDCSFLMIPIHESLKDSTEIVAYPYKQEQQKRKTYWKLYLTPLA